MLTKVKATLAKPENAYMKVQKKKAFRVNRKTEKKPEGGGIKAYLGYLRDPSNNKICTMCNIKS